MTTTVRLSDADFEALADAVWRALGGRCGCRGKAFCPRDFLHGNTLGEILGSQTTDGGATVERWAAWRAVPATFRANHNEFPRED